MLNKRTKLEIKRMGEVDQIPFREMCLERIPSEDWQGVAAKICSCWQDQVQDPLWHPFKIDSSDGITRVCLLFTCIGSFDLILAKKKKAVI